MNAKSHLIILSPGFPESEEDSICIPPIQLFLLELQKQHPDVLISVITFHYPFKPEPYDWHNIRVYPLNGGNLKGLSKLSLWKKAYSKLKRLHKKIPIDHIHSFWANETAMIGNYFARKKNIQHSVTFMGQDVLHKNRYIKYLTLKKSINIVLSDNHAKFLKSNFSITPEYIIPWGVKLPKPVKKSYEYDIIGVGSLISLKNYALFINTIAEIQKTYPKIKSCIIGDGPEKTNLQRLIEQLNLQNNIQLKGSLPYDETMLQIASSNTLLHTSSFESFGMIFIEALAQKTKIVSFDVGYAHKNQNWKIANQEKDFAPLCIELLNQEFVEYNESYLIENTVKSYSKLFFNN